MQLYVVPLLLFGSSVLMAFAWLGHIRFRQYRYTTALLVSWCVVLPEYVLNIIAFRWGHGTYQGGEMAAMNLGFGVVCVALVARYFLGEVLNRRQIVGFAIMAVAVFLVLYPSPSTTRELLADPSRAEASP
jgi:uncharacterized protein (DUF486 family)